MKIEVNLSFNTDDMETFDANMRRLSQLMALCAGVPNDRPLGTPAEIVPDVVVGAASTTEDLMPAPVADEPRDAIVWTHPLRDVAVRLNAGHTSWRKLDRPLRQSLAIQVIRNLIEGGYCTMPEFDRRRPAWMPKAISLAMSFGLKWTELVDLALPGKVSPVPPPITGASTSVARVSAGHVQQSPTQPSNTNGHSTKGGYL